MELLNFLGDFFIFLNENPIWGFFLSSVPGLLFAFVGAYFLRRKSRMPKRRHVVVFFVIGLLFGVCLMGICLLGPGISAPSGGYENRVLGTVENP